MLRPLERARQLRKEADIVLNLIGLDEILSTYGSVYPTGSYLLDVMVYPDIDLYITKVSIDQLFEIGALCARNENVIQVVFERTADPERLPEGLYLKLRIKFGSWGRLWKIDIWSIAEEVIQSLLLEMRHFKERLTPELRSRIIDYKLSVLTSQKRTPKYSGYYIYKAFLDEGLSDFGSVTQYLISHGIIVNGEGE